MNKPLSTLTASFVIIAALSGCSTVANKLDYACPLDTPEAAKCASVEDAYAASRNMGGTTGRKPVQSVFDPRVQNGSMGQAAPVLNNEPSGYPEPSQQGMPVFKQPKVMRVWVAPYVDADGNLRSGEYAYFSTPGQWNYGELRKPGEASGMMGPARPDKSGFNGVAPAQKNPNTPASPPAASTRGVPSAPAAANAVTQPYQRLSK